MADEKTQLAKTVREALAERDSEIRKALEGYAKKGEDARKLLEGLTTPIDSFQKVLEGLNLNLGKELAGIGDITKQFDEMLNLVKEGKLGEYSDETLVPDLMERMKRLKEAQKLALETGKPDLTVANAWLDSHWPSPRPCPICKHDEWGIGPTFAQIPTSAFGHNMPPRVNPCVAVVCGHCGNTVLLNAIVMGLVPSPKSED